MGPIVGPSSDLSGCCRADVAYPLVIQQLGITERWPQAAYACTLLVQLKPLCKPLREVTSVSHHSCTAGTASAISSSLSDHSFAPRSASCAAADDGAGTQSA